MEREVTIVGFYSPSGERNSFLGRPVWRELSSCHAHDARILTELVSTRECYDELTAQGKAIPMLVPDVLRLESEGR
jgi:hypothetical protein